MANKRKRPGATKSDKEKKADAEIARITKKRAAAAKKKAAAKKSATGKIKTAKAADKKAMNFQQTGLTDVKRKLGLGRKKKKKK